MAQAKTSSKKSKRIDFGSSPLSIDYPDFLDIQLKSFEDFFQIETLPEHRESEGLFKVFSENFPITDTRNQFVLEFLDYFIDPPRYSIDECIERGLTYSVPLKAKLKLYCTDPEHEDFETIVQDVYLGQIPYMTPKGSFVVNGAERVVVSQLHRSPGVFFGQSRHANGTKLYSARVIPFKGSWIEFATDINGVMYAYIDRKKKLPVTTLLRAIGFESDKQILEIFGLADEIKVTKAALKESVGRKLAARVLKSWVEDFVDEDTGEVVSIDSSGPALERARAHVALNGFDAARATFLDADVNASLRQFLREGRRFDAIVLDPPKFAPTVTHAERAARAYKDINRLALQLLEPGGVLYTFSCSGGISADLFHKIVASAGADAGVDGYILERLGGAPDHPMTLEFPEGEYLKGLAVMRK